MLKLAFITLCFLVLDINGDCLITRTMVEGTNRIFTYRDASKSYHLQRTENVKTGVVLHMICTPGDVVETKCQKDGTFTVPLPKPCVKPMTTTLLTSVDRKCPGKIYSIGYAIGGKHMELFRSCYDVATARAVYAESDVYHKTFYARRPEVPFISDNLETMGASYIKQSIYKAFCDIFGDSQKFVPKDKLTINRGHLVASADFLFVDQMISTYRYINVVPQFKSINEGNWQKVESWLRTHVPQSSPYRIKTGGIDVLALRDERTRKAKHVYLAGNKLPVPQWMYKSVKDSNNRGIYVFLFFNSIFKTDSKPRAHESCKPVKCPVTFPNNAAAGYYYCCHPASFPH